MILLVLTGLLSTASDSLAGIGGGIIIVPTLAYLGVDHHLLYGVTIQIAIGTSSAVLIATGLSSSVGHLKTRQVDIKDGSIFLLRLLPGSLIDSFLNRYLTSNPFNLYFDILMIYISILLMIRHKIKPFKIFDRKKYRKTYTDAKGMIYHCSVPSTFAFFATLFMGVLIGLFGIGGGVLTTLLMLIVFRFPPHVTVGTSMMMIFLSSVMSSIGHITRGHVVWLYSTILVVSGYTGAQTGVKINHSIKSKTVILLLRTVVLIMDVYLTIKSFL